MAHSKKLILLSGLLLALGCGTSVEKQAAKNVAPVPMIPNLANGTEPTSVTTQDLIDVAPGQVTRTRYQASIIDTSTFENSVWRTEPHPGPVRDVEGIRGNDADPPEIKQGKPNDLRVNGNVAQYSRIEPVTRFPGISQSLFTPPDPTLAVGPNHIVEMVNTEIAFLTKTGTVQFQAILGDQGNPGFFEDIGAGGFCVDPRCFYDHYEDRFVVLCLEVYFSPPETFLTLAVSDDDDPNGVWYKYRTDGAYMVGGVPNFADYPSWGYDANGYYISGNLFGISDFSFRGVSFRTIDKTPLLSGDPIVVNDTVVTDFSITSVQMAQCFGTNNGPVGISFNSQNEATLIALNDPFGNLNVETVDVPIPFFLGGNGANNNGGFISTLSSRAMNAHVRDNKFYSCHTVGQGNLDVARWYEFDLNGWPNGANPSLIQSGNINLGGGRETFFPAIYSNKNGSIGLVYGRSSNSEFVSVNASGRNVDDPVGTMSQMFEFEVGSVPADGRYGDYFDIAVDPTDDSTFWIVGETQESFGWNTVINSFVMPVLGDVNCDGTVNLLDVAPFIELINSGGFSDKADINGDGTLDLLDVGPFVDLLSGN